VDAEEGRVIVKTPPVVSAISLSPADAEMFDVTAAQDDEKAVLIASTIPSSEAKVFDERLKDVEKFVAVVDSLKDPFSPLVAADLLSANRRSPKVESSVIPLFVPFAFKRIYPSAALRSIFPKVASTSIPPEELISRAVLVVLALDSTRSPLVIVERVRLAPVLLMLVTVRFVIEIEASKFILIWPRPLCAAVRFVPKLSVEAELKTGTKLSSIANAPTVAVVSPSVENCSRDKVASKYRSPASKTRGGDERDSKLMPRFTLWKLFPNFYLLNIYRSSSKFHN